MNTTLKVIGVISIGFGIFAGMHIVTDIQLTLAAVLLLGGLNLLKG